MKKKRLASSAIQRIRYSLLKNDFNAKPEHIFLARTSYDYEANSELLEAYLIKLDELIAQHGLKPGPDFFKAYSTNREKWYGEDQAHPNIADLVLDPLLNPDPLLTIGNNLP